MPKFIVLLIALSMTAASCDFFGDRATGPAGVLKSEDSAESFHFANKITGGEISGLSVNALTVDPNNSKVIYLGAGNGIYKTEEDANLWKYILNGIAVVDIAVDPFDTQKVYAAGLSGSQGKIIKSTDGGTSWIDIYTEPTKDNPMLAVAVSPIDSNKIVAGLSTGEIIRSTDGGHTWQTATDFGDRIIKIKFDKSNRVYALTRKKGLNTSTDAGLNWTSTTTTLTSSILSSKLSTSSVSLFHDLALDQRQPGVIYLATEQGVIRTVDNGDSWSFIDLPLKDSALKTTAIAVNPANSNNLLAVVSSTLFKSSNGGLTWETKKLPSGQTTRILFFNQESTNIIYLGLGAKK